MITRPQSEDYGRPLLCNGPRPCRKVITDQMNILEEYGMNLHELRKSLQDEGQHEEQRFQSSVLAVWIKLTRQSTRHITWLMALHVARDNVLRRVRKSTCTHKVRQSCERRIRESLMQ